MTDFHTFASLHGLVIRDLYPSPRIRRCPTEDHPRKRNGAYFYDGDRGWAQRWDQGGELMWWDDPDKAAPTQAERDEWARKKVEREARQQRMWGKGRSTCEALLKTAVLKEHGYLYRKGHNDVKGLVLPDDSLFIPMRNFVTGNICGGQRIFLNTEEAGAPRWEKKYVLGSQPAGAAYRIGPDRHFTDLILCEGYATGLSLNKAIGQMHIVGSVLVCFNDANMINIARLLRATPERVYVFADNDASGAGESAAQAAGLPYCMSPVVGEDANDLHQRAGLFPVTNALMDARKRAIKETS